MRRARWLRLAAAAAAALGSAWVATACDRVLGVDGDWTVAPPPSGSGAAGAGGAATSSSASASGGTAGSGGTEIKDCTPDDPGPFAGGEACPVNMVDSGGVCVDAHEATFADYLGVVDRHALSCFEDNLVRDTTCAGNEPFNVGESVFRGANDDLPAHPLDYCDAEAYCRLRGRTLCTAVEWRSACSPDPGLSFPWGGDSSGGHCIDHPFIEPVDREPNTCRRADALAAITDMPGNVAEFIFGCSRGVCAPCSDDLNCLAAGARIAALDGGAPPDDCNALNGAPHRSGLGDHDVVPELRTGVRCCYHPPR